jgi:flagellar basal-body rod modification protein FlgD
MTVSATSNNNTAANTAAGSPTKGKTSTDAFAQLNSNFEMFLTLLTTQLKNQDPLQPQDSAAFTNQLVQFSNVEQNIGTNDRLDQLLTYFKGNQNTTALDYIGKSVEFQDTFVPLQNGQANIAVTLGANAGSASLVIKNTAGETVATKTLPGNMGSHVVTWNGVDDSGKQLSDGTYVVSVDAPGSDGKQVASDIHVRAKVTGVDLSGDTAMLMMGNLPLEMSKVITIQE